VKRSMCPSMEEEEEEEVYVYSDDYTIREIKEKFSLRNKTFTEINSTLATAITNKIHFNLLHFILVISLIIIISFMVGLLLYMKRKYWRQRCFNMFNNEQKINPCYDDILPVDIKNLNHTQADNERDYTKRMVS
jgi:hypothetical protein